MLVLHSRRPVASLQELYLSLDTYHQIICIIQLFQHAFTVSNFVLEVEFLT
jgi:hypothetical protein